MADGEDLPHHASGPRATSSPGRLALTFRFWRSDSASHGPLDAGFPSAECSRATRSLHDRRQRGNRRLNHAIHMAAVTQIHRRHSDGRASATSGRAIVISGLTVMISLAGLFLSGISIFSGLAIGTITVVGLSVLGSVTVLPALLAWLGRFTDRGRIPLVGRRRTAASQSRLWAALVRRVVRHPGLWGGAAAIALLALAGPALGIRASNPGLHELPASVPVIGTLTAIQHAFPGDPALTTRIEEAIAPSAAQVAQLDEIPGIGVTAAQEIIAEIGTDMSRFPTAGHLVSWAKFAPKARQSAGRSKAASTGKGNPWLGGTIGEAATAAGRTSTFLASRYKRIVKRRGTNAPSSPATPSSPSPGTCCPTPPPASATSDRTGTTASPRSDATPAHRRAGTPVRYESHPPGGGRLTYPGHPLPPPPPHPERIRRRSVLNGLINEYTPAV